MSLLFVYGSLKQGFVNEHINTGRRVDGQYRTHACYPLVLLGEGDVPCLIASPGTGHQVIGEVYEVNDGDIARMDKLERLGEPEGYERLELDIERFDLQPPRIVRAFVYMKRPHAIPPGTPRSEPFAEYKPEHAARFRWTGAA